MAEVSDTRMTFPCRMAYVHLDKPHAAPGTDKLKYSVTALIPKDAPFLADIKAATAAAKQRKWNGKAPAGLRAVVRDGDEKDEEGNFIRRGEEFRGHYYIACSSDRPVPVVVGKNRIPATPDQMVSGYYAAVSVNFYGYEAAGNKGVAAGLNAVWITRKGDVLGAGDPTADFANINVDAEDFATAATGFAGDPFAAAGAKKSASGADEF